jgi:hypothetical protein
MPYKVYFIGGPRDLTAETFQRQPDSRIRVYVPNSMPEFPDFHAQPDAATESNIVTYELRPLYRRRDLPYDVWVAIPA